MSQAAMAETGLLRYDAMCKAIAECHRIDEAVDIRHKAKALEVYAKQAMNTDAEMRAIEIRMRAERRSGELLKEMKDNGERKGRGGTEAQMSRSTTIAPKLSDLGITRDQSSQWQRLAEVPQEQFEAAFKAPTRPSTTGILAAAGKATAPPKIPVDHGALWAYSRVADFEKIMQRPAGELFGLMQDFQREHLEQLVPKLILWLKELK